LIEQQQQIIIIIKGKPYLAREAEHSPATP